jgi:hypothetical protein
MKPKIYNVSLTREISNLSYPIIVGDNILRDSGEILKEFISKKKIIVIHDSFFSNNHSTNNSFMDIINCLKKLFVL